MTALWKLLGGISFFLIGMNFLEESLQNLAGRPFKLFFKKHTSSNIKSFFSGVLSATILQSSSVVNLMALAFAGANIIKIQYALAIIIGANLGTTLSSWIIALLGFSFHIESVSLCFVGLFGIGMVLTNKETNLYHWNKFLFGFGLLFFGLSYITAGMNLYVGNVNLFGFNHLSALWLLLLGFIFTALIQSSTATVALLLSALYSEAISLYTAMSILLGAEAGTSVKLIFASFKGSVVKRQIAIGNLLFNVFSILPSIIFLHSIEVFIVHVLQFENNLYALVFFQTLINFIGVVIFYPFLKKIGLYLERAADNSKLDDLFIRKVDPENTVDALESLDKDVSLFLNLSLEFSKNIFVVRNHNRIRMFVKKAIFKKGFSDIYEHLKHIHGSCHEYAVQIEKSNLKDDEKLILARYASSNRNTMYALKSIKDCMMDIRLLRNSSNNIKFQYFNNISEKAQLYSSWLIDILKNENRSNHFNDLKKFYNQLTQDYTLSLEIMKQESFFNGLTDTEISTLVNFNRLTYSIYKSFFYAVKEYLLPKNESDYFEKMPGFIR